MAGFHPKAKPLRLAPLKAIRAKCIDCCAGSVAEVAKCEATGCSLWPYRNGHRPSEEIERGNLSDWKALHGYGGDA